MSAKITLGVTYQCYGTIEIDLPDTIDPKDTKAVQNYIDNHWNEMPRPNGSYIPDSDEPNYDDMRIEESD